MAEFAEGEEVFHRPSARIVGAQTDPKPPAPAAGPPDDPAGARDFSRVLLHFNCVLVIERTRNNAVKGFRRYC